MSPLEYNRNARAFEYEPERPLWRRIASTLVEPIARFFDWLPGWAGLGLIVAADIALWVAIVAVIVREALS